MLKSLERLKWNYEIIKLQRYYVFFLLPTNDGVAAYTLVFPCALIYGNCLSSNYNKDVICLPSLFDV